MAAGGNWQDVTTRDFEGTRGRGCAAARGGGRQTDPPFSAPVHSAPQGGAWDRRHLAGQGAKRRQASLDTPMG